MKVDLRPVADSDTPLLFELYAATREPEMARVPWPAEQKQAFLAMQFRAQSEGYSTTHPNATHQIILADDRPVGRLYLDRGTDEYHILDITVAENYRNQGIGATVLNDVIADADRQGKPVTIYTETFNPSLRLFERLGFRQDSVDGFLVLLKRPSGGSADRQSD